MDPVSEVTLAWLEQRAARRGIRVESSSFEHDYVRLEFPKMVHNGVEGSVGELVRPTHQEIALAILLRTGERDLTVEVTRGANLPQALRARLSPQFEALAERGIEIDSIRFTAVLTTRIAGGLAEAADQYRLPPQLHSFLRMPGPPFDDISDILNEIDEIDEEDERGEEDEEAIGGVKVLVEDSGLNASSPITPPTALEEPPADEPPSLPAQL